MKNILALFIIISLSSCANYMNSLYNTLDEGSPQATKRDTSKFDLYRNKNNSPSTSNNNRLMPTVQREYQPEEQVRKRYKAKDLVDGQGDGSLWSGENERNYLFSNQKIRRSGDIVLINILGRFKREITQELQRTFPAPAPVIKSTAKTAPKVGSPAPPTSDQDGADEKAVVHDRISAVIIEEINKDHLLIKGRKNLLFRNKKRIIEIQALVSKRDISDDDSVDSDNFLESAINILR